MVLPHRIWTSQVGPRIVEHEYRLQLTNDLSHLFAVSRGALKDALFDKIKHLQ